VVTGGASGIGLAVVRRLLARGTAVTVLDIDTVAVDRLLADPNGRLTPLRGNELWQIALLELWLQRHGITGAAA
jgi:NAD(P)-dependent dehydrogenase (short-subunit alcohol dehydrogenase family)